MSGSQTAPAITHLLFADDSFLFFKATLEESAAIKNVLNSYEKCSRQAINYQKSGIFFSANVHRDKQREIEDTMQVRNDLSTAHYLGLPSLVGRSKNAVFNIVKEKV